MKQKVIITDSEDEINQYLINGWSVTMIVPQSITGMGDTSYNTKSGGFCFLLEKDE